MKKKDYISERFVKPLIITAFCSVAFAMVGLFVLFFEDILLGLTIISASLILGFINYCLEILSRTK